MKLKLIVLFFLMSAYALAEPEAYPGSEQPPDEEKQREIEQLEVKLRETQVKFFPCENIKYLDDGFRMTKDEINYMNYVWERVEELVPRRYKRHRERSFMGVLSVNMNGKVLSVGALKISPKGDLKRLKSILMDLELKPTGIDNDCLIYEIPVRAYWE